MVTLYDNGPYTGSLVEGSHDTITLVVKHEESLAVIDVIGNGGPVMLHMYIYERNHLHIPLSS